MNFPHNITPDLMTQCSSQPQLLKNPLTLQACFPTLYQHVNLKSLGLFWPTPWTFSSKMPLLFALEATTGLPTSPGQVAVPNSPGNKQVPVTECSLKPRPRFCDTVLGHRDLAGISLLEDCFICSKWWEILYINFLPAFVS